MQPGLLLCDIWEKGVAMSLAWHLDFEQRKHFSFILVVEVAACVRQGQLIMLFMYENGGYIVL